MKITISDLKKIINEAVREAFENKPSATEFSEFEKNKIIKTIKHGYFPDTFDILDSKVLGDKFIVTATGPASLLDDTGILCMPSADFTDELDDVCDKLNIKWKDSVGRYDEDKNTIVDFYFTKAATNESVREALSKEDFLRKRDEKIRMAKQDDDAAKDYLVNLHLKYVEEKIDEDPSHGEIILEVPTGGEWKEKFKGYDAGHIMFGEDFTNDLIKKLKALYPYLEFRIRKSGFKGDGKFHLYFNLIDD